MNGRLGAIYIASGPASRVWFVDRVRAVPGRGLEGDRYFTGTGSFSHWPKPGRELTLIAAETLEILESGHGLALEPGAHRRNLVTEGVELMDLVKTEFRIGAVRLRGERPCLPCRVLERRTLPGVYEAMKKTGGGLRATIVTEGFLSVGDPILLARHE